MALRRCTVGFTAATGVAHFVVVEAETLFEAAALGLARLKKDGWIEGLGPGTKLEIHVSEPGTNHVVPIQQLKRWLEGTSGSPAEVLRRSRVKKMLEL